MPKNTSITGSLIQNHSLVSDQIYPNELGIILETLLDAFDHKVAGDIVELGCYVGTTSLFLQRLIRLYSPKTKLYVYDSFEGLPAKTAEDENNVGEQYKSGELSANKNKLINNFKKAGLDLPIVKKAWFSDLTPADLPGSICFAFLDGDFYSSIKDSLKLVGSKISEGGYIVVDDYQTEALPGVAKAVDEWLITHPNKFRIEASLAIIGPL